MRFIELLIHPKHNTYCINYCTKLVASHKSASVQWHRGLLGGGALHCYNYLVQRLSVCAIDFDRLQMATVISWPIVDGIRRMFCALCRCFVCEIEPTIVYSNCLCKVCILAQIMAMWYDPLQSAYNANCLHFLLSIICKLN